GLDEKCSVKRVLFSLKFSKRQLAPPAPSLTASTHGLRRAPPPHRFRRRFAHAPSPPEVRCRCALPGLPLPRRQRPPHLPQTLPRRPHRAPPSSPSPQPCPSRRP